MRSQKSAVFRCDGDLLRLGTFVRAVVHEQRNQCYQYDPANRATNDQPHRVAATAWGTALTLVANVYVFVDTITKINCLKRIPVIFCAPHVHSVNLKRELRKRSRLDGQP